MIAPDDLKPGLLFTILGEVAPADESWGDRPQEVRSALAGAAFRVVAVSYPFVAVLGPGGRGWIDARRYKLDRVNRAYAKAVTPGLFAPPKRRQLPAKGLKPLAGGGANCCTECGGRLVQRKTESSHAWFVACRDCDHVAPAVTTPPAPLA